MRRLVSNSHLHDSFFTVAYRTLAPLNIISARYLFMDRLLLIALRLVITATSTRRRENSLVSIPSAQRLASWCFSTKRLASWCSTAGRVRSFPQRCFCPPLPSNSIMDYSLQCYCVFHGPVASPCSRRHGWSSWSPLGVPITTAFCGSGSVSGSTRHHS